MVTARINIPKHLAEFCMNYADENGVITFPRQWDIYATIADLMGKRPVNVSPVDEGNIAISLPDRHDQYGKNPIIYNFLSQSAQHIIAQRIERIFWMHVHDILYEEKCQKNIDYIQTAYAILEQWKVTSITTDAIIKHYYRFRQNMKKSRPEFRSASTSFGLHF